MKLRDYQLKLATEGVEILRNKKIVYYCCEVRIGKTAIALETCRLFGAKKVLFVTKKKAVSSIERDHFNFGFDFEIVIINTESLHKILDNDFDIVISDEHHKYGAFPKPNATAKEFKKRFSKLPMIFLSGTPTPESYSQWFHQFWVSDYSPYKNYANFYKWAAEYVDIKEKRLGYAVVKDYSNAKENFVRRSTRPYIITFTQKEAGFTTSVNEMVLECEMQPITYEVIRRLKKDLIVRNGQGQVILGDTGVKLMQKVHQLSSGTCKFEDGTSKVIDDSKARFIKEKFKGEKIAIFYKFKAEWDALLQVFGADYLTNSVEEFDATDKNIALQIVSGREGVSLKNAKYLVYYNIDFSATSYWQSRDRMTTMQRQENEVFWIFSKGGIEYDIYKTVQQKKDYTLKIFRQNERTISI
jgi:superfamily II DNA or RNA helicase